MNVKTQHVSFLAGRLGLMAIAIWAAFATPVASADVEGEHVVIGDVTFERFGDLLRIHASDGAIINYHRFDIGADEIFRFIQPGEDARVLNRITGAFPTYIDGTLLANGHVYIVNPSGVIFGAGSVVDVAGLHAAAGHISDNNFLRLDKDRFTDLSGDVINAGEINAGEIFLFGNRVINEGTIHADPRGIVAMVAGEEIIVRRLGEHLMVKVDGKRILGRDRPYEGSTSPDMAAQAGVLNTGEIEVPRGRAIFGAGDMYGLAIHNTGTIRGKRAQVDMVATDGLIHNEGLIDVSNFQGTGGDIVVQAPSLLNSGEIRADAINGYAGTIEFTSDDHTYLRNGSVISAAGLDHADGGEVLVHSYRGHTAFAREALVDVSGGSVGGHGGFAELSGYAMTLNGFVDLSASPGYSEGTLLIDPWNIIINVTGLHDGFLDDGIIEFDEGGSEDAYIAASTLENFVGQIILQAQSTIFVDAPLNFQYDNDVRMEAMRTITVRHPITGAHDLQLFADVDSDGQGWVSINAPVSITGDAVLSGVSIFLQGDHLTSGGSQDYLSPVWLGTDYVLEGTQVTFHDTLNSRGAHGEPILNRSIRIDGDLAFQDAVGELFELRFVDVHGAAILSGGLVRTNEHQIYRGPTTLGSDMHLVSLMDRTIRFNDALDGAFHLLATTGGMTRFDGPVGQSEALASLTTDAPGATHISDDVHAAVVELNDAVSLGDDVRFTAEQSVTFASTVDGNDYSLIVDSPWTLFDDDVTAIDLLRTDADGVTIIDADRVFGRRLNFRDEVVLTSDSHLKGDRSIDFWSTVDGPFHLRLTSDRLVRFGGDVGGDDALASLRTEVGGTGLIDENLVVIDGNLIRAVGDIEFNPQGKNRPAEVATVAANGDVRIESVDGDVSFGVHEKLTALGDLSLLASSGSVTLNDVNSDGDLLVDADEINLRRRDAGFLLDAEGDRISDEGPEIIASGNIDFSRSPTLIGDGADPIIATRSGGGISETLSALEQRSFEGLTSNDFFFGMPRLVLDLTAPAQPTPPSPPVPPGPPAEPRTRLSSDPAVIYDSRGQISDKVELDAFALRPLDQLAIRTRAMREDELVATTEGRALYLDSVSQGALPDEPAPTLAHRLRRASVLAVSDLYGELFLVEVVDPQTGETTFENRSDEIRDSIAAAWTAYEAEAGAEPDPGGFTSFLAESESHNEALTDVEALRELFEELHTMGVTAREMNLSRDAVLDPLTSAEVDRATLEQIAVAESAG